MLNYLSMVQMAVLWAGALVVGKLTPRLRPHPRPLRAPQQEGRALSSPLRSL